MQARRCLRDRLARGPTSGLGGRAGNPVVVPRRSGIELYNPSPSPDGRWVAYASTMMVVEVTGPDTKLSEPKPLFSVEPYYRGSAYVAPNWDVSADGQRFVMTRFLEEPDTAPPHHLEIVTNFYDELRQKLP